MKIKLFSLLLAFAMSTVMFAGNTPAVPTPATDVADIYITVSIDQVDFDESALTGLFTDLEQLSDENLTCEVTFKVKVGYGGSGVEASVTVKGDCDEVVAEAKKRIDEIKEMVNKR